MRRQTRLAAQVLSGETRFLRIRAYPEKIGAAARFWSISAHYRTVQYILYFSTFALLLLLLFYGTSVKFQMLNLSKFVSLAFIFQIFDLSKFVSLAVKFQIFDLSKFVSLAYCCKMQAHSTMRGKRPKIIDVDLLSDVSSPKCHSPKSPRIKEEELDDIEEMQVEAQVEEDVMGLSDAESDEVEEEEEASNVSFSDDIGDLGDSEGEEEDSKEEDPLPPIKVGDIFGKNLSNKDVTAEVFFCFDPFYNALLALS